MDALCEAFINMTANRQNLIEYRRVNAKLLLKLLTAGRIAQQQFVYQSIVKCVELF